MNLIQNETLRAHVTTIGHDFDNYGGEASLAFMMLEYFENYQPDHWRAGFAWFTSKLTNAPDLEIRGSALFAAFKALTNEFKNADWLVETLTAYYGEIHGLENPRECAEGALKRAAEVIQHSETEDAASALSRELRVVWLTLTKRNGANAGVRRRALSNAWAIITGKVEGYAFA